MWIFQNVMPNGIPKHLPFFPRSLQRVFLAIVYLVKGVVHLATVLRWTLSQTRTPWARTIMIQTEAERRRREAGVKQSMEIRLGSCMWVGEYGIWNYLANQGT